MMTQIVIAAPAIALRNKNRFFIMLIRMYQRLALFEVLQKFQSQLHGTRGIFAVAVRASGFGVVRTHRRAADHDS